jgi:hypothetical protein
MGLGGWNGMDGKDGAVGPMGPAGPAGEIIEVLPQTDGCSWCSPLLSPMVILGLLIWLAVVSVILIVTISIVAYRKNNADYKKTKKYAASQSELWKKYETAGFDNEGYETPKVNGTSPEPTYSTVEEGRTEF